jgi:hypothetical protein
MVPCCAAQTRQGDRVTTYKDGENESIIPRRTIYLVIKFHRRILIVNIETLRIKHLGFPWEAPQSLDAPLGLNDALHGIAVLGARKHPVVEVGGLIAIDRSGKYCIPEPLSGSNHNVPVSEQTLFMRPELTEVGTVHTHPTLDNVDVPDLVTFINRGLFMALTLAPTTQYLVIRTRATPKHVPFPGTVVARLHKISGMMGRLVKDDEIADQKEIYATLFAYALVLYKRVKYGPFTRVFPKHTPHNRPT